MIPSSIRSTLRERIHCIDRASIQQEQIDLPKSYVLYLPTVVLRKKHNPAFTLACHLGNHYNVPVIVLAVVLDDTHNNDKSSVRKKVGVIVSTERRTAFVLEALQECCHEWSEHGAGVAIRVHGGAQSRTPHHLTLARNATAVVTDEPFVHPYLSFVQSVERVSPNKVYRVDGSTTVPPNAILTKKKKSLNAINDDNSSEYDKIPAKAWIWEKRTEPDRKRHILGVVQDGDFDAPDLLHRLSDDFFLNKNNDNTLVLPTEWKERSVPSPWKRPWTVSELREIHNIKAWVQQQQHGTDNCRRFDNSVPVCNQTHGSNTAGIQRWHKFRQEHLSNYAKRRNDIALPHGVSRMSSYLNYGIVSIFELMHDIYWNSSSSTATAKRKFIEEVVKWREIGYVHAFCFPHTYRSAASIPLWARQYFEKQHNKGSSSASYSLRCLEDANTRDSIWNAMQEYLNTTGELHNNARMTWGKTIVHWQKTSCTAQELLEDMIYLNDRFALDGLSPPSYAGLLWCFGWGDKPSSSVSTKNASRYRKGPNDFLLAKRRLHADANQKPQSQKNNLMDHFLSVKTKKVPSSSEENQRPQKKQKTAIGDKDNSNSLTTVG
mmetsp:Transcript_20231/g.23088  ORF Transcript_20231/g.23088 Transcript_20231/m.23088 type:complete len:603 (+) Transcript_20231:120-1928(+)|eukprot:CAMPEP_0194178458 /NCGR_PEP_ID=MMETSP0154-20130528/12056_1 /TAXON_ID=1049557 /ORGANISM="Thalassiothrix antarctica, Strain L6-D1" /LENGTH=602 /DNA_ID=CAMNT_0038893419 /DNA_START=81 /DNA_END=1889 /DNA_ORIENTATION=+